MTLCCSEFGIFFAIDFFKEFLTDVKLTFFIFGLKIDVV